MIFSSLNRLFFIVRSSVRADSNPYRGKFTGSGQKLYLKT